jgi:hypothetical protein
MRHGGSGAFRQPLTVDSALIDRLVMSSQRAQK